MLSLLFAAVTLPAASQTVAMPQIYHETYRPLFHFSPRKDWLNDPNGLVYFEGTWHLFYQYAPDLRGNAPKYWGYAKSPDLVHWKEQDLAFKPDRDGAVWSGGAAVDWTNSTGFGKNRKPPLVGMYTAAGNPFTQCLVYSDDGGKTWGKYPHPVLDNVVGENRDPRPVWYEPGKSWVMALYLQGHDFGFYGSKDMKTWTELSRLKVPGSSECPEFFQMPVEGRKGQSRWVFFGGNYRYLIGSFDGKTFTPEVGPIQGDFGNAFYASQTWSDGPRGRRVQIAWMPRGEPMPGMNFTGQMSFPCELRLKATSDGLRLTRLPVKEIARLHTEQWHWDNQTLHAGVNPLWEIPADRFDVEASFNLGNAERVGLRVRGEEISVDRSGLLRCLGKEVQIPGSIRRIRLRVLVDTCSLEVFAGDGLVSMTSYFEPHNHAPNLEAFAAGGSARMDWLSARKIVSAW